MIQYFNPQELNISKKQRKKVLIVYFCCLAVFICAIVPFLIWYWRLPYMAKEISTIKTIVFVLVAVFTIFSYIYLGIKFARVNKYYRLCINLITGIREEYTGIFLRYCEEIEDKDGVDCKSLIFKEWNKYKKVFFERKVLVFYEKDFPQLIENKTVRYIVQGNILIEYEYMDVQGEEK